MLKPTLLPPGFHALIVDDERSIRSTLAVCLEHAGCAVSQAENAESALACVRVRAFDVAFVDLRLGRDSSANQGSGVDLIPSLLAAQPSLCVVVITAYATIETAVLAMARGAFDYLPKPFTPAQIHHVLRQVAERRALTRRVATLESALSAQSPELDWAPEALAMRAVLELVARAAASDASVLLRGENGTGKGVIAQALHAQSRRAQGPYVVVNCPTLSEELLASELFGHVKGAFTGAVRDQPGRVELAEGGTLFLDEIAELSPALQSKLLRFLQDKAFERVGDGRVRSADVRVIAATNRDLEADVKQGRFREDLLYRLNVLELTVPPLRERREDIFRLAQRFLEFFARDARRPPQSLSPEVEAALVAYGWPGNVRELRNVMERVTILWPAQRVELAALPERMRGVVAPRPHVGGDFTLAQVEHEHMVEVMARAPTLEEAARILGIESSTLWRKRKKMEQGEP